MDTEFPIPDPAFESRPPAAGRLADWLTVPWPPAFFVPGCFCCGGGANAYSCGGMNLSSSIFYSTTDRTSFANDTTSNIPGANLTTARGEAGSASNPGLAGYIAGGKTSVSGAVTIADKLTFAAESTSALTSANLSTGRYAMGSLSERTSKAYFAGGFSTPINSITDKLLFASDATSAQTTANLSTSRGGLRAISDGATKGYFGGGFLSSTTWTTRSDKITYATDVSTAQTTADLSTGRDRYQSISDGSTKGYFAGGQTGVGFAICDKVTFATDVTTTQTSTAINRFGGSGMANGVIGYAFGGIDASGFSKSGHKFNFATDSVAALGGAADLSSQRLTPAGLSTVGL